MTAVMSGDLTTELARLAERVRASTVQVRSRGPGGGSGVIWASDGLIVTNAHVARGDRAEVETEDRVYDAEIISRDDRLDLAALRVDAVGLPAAAVGDSDRLRVGEIVLAVGNPLGLTGAVATGIVHAISPDRPSWVRADIRLLPGNSGGPLVNTRGEVIGINSMVAGGLGMAVPSNAVRRFLGGRAVLGITAQPVLVPSGDGERLGFLVLAVEPDGAAASAGMLLGDVLIGVDGVWFTRPSDIASVPWDTPHGVDVMRGGRVIRLLVAEAGQAAA